MNWLAIALILFISAMSASAATTDTSDTRAYLCELAQRDAAITDEDYDKYVQEWKACMSKNKDEEKLKTQGGCTAVTNKWGTKLECTSSHEYHSNGAECPEHPRKLKARMENADERVKRYCEQDP